MTDKPKRRWFQFRLRTLMVFVTLCAVACSWFTVRWQRARGQREAVEAIEKAGGSVLYDYQVDADWILTGVSEPPVPGWLRNVLGEDFFSDVVIVGLLSGVGNDRVVYLKRLTGLRSLSLKDSQVTDSGLEHLQGLTKLERLDLGRTQVTDAGLEQLRGLTNMRELLLYSTQVTDAGVKKLQEALPNCSILH